MILRVIIRVIGVKGLATDSHGSTRVEKPDHRGHGGAQRKIYEAAGPVSDNLGGSSYEEISTSGGD